jgi:hypothetical protein
VTPEAVADELDRRYAVAVDNAARLFAERGELWPFALAATTDGEVVAPAETASRPRPEVGQVRSLLLAELRERHDGLRAVALCSDVQLEGADRPSSSSSRPATGSAWRCWCPTCRDRGCRTRSCSARPPRWDMTARRARRAGLIPGAGPAGRARARSR